MADDRFGVIDSSKVYDETSLLNVLTVGVTGKESRKRYLHRHFIKRNLPFVKIGTKKLISGHLFNLWVQSLSQTFDQWQEDPADDDTEDNEDQDHQEN